jgi:hypothetical protein
LLARWNGRRRRREKRQAAFFCFFTFFIILFLLLKFFCLKNDGACLSATATGRRIGKNQNGNGSSTTAGKS